MLGAELVIPFWHEEVLFFRWHGSNDNGVSSCDHARWLPHTHHEVATRVGSVLSDENARNVSDVHVHHAKENAWLSAEHDHVGRPRWVDHNVFVQCAWQLARTE
jgi:hypothetical protein